MSVHQFSLNMHVYMCGSMHVGFSVCRLGDSAQFALAKASQLPAMLQEEKKSLQDEKTQLRKDKTKRQYQFTQYHKVL